MPTEWICKVNRASRSNIVESGTPWRRIMLATYNSASHSTEKVTMIGMKWTDLVNRSTTTHIASYPSIVLGNPTTKSMVIWSHFHSGSSRVVTRQRDVYVQHWPSDKSSICWHTRLHLSSSRSTRNAPLSLDTSSLLLGGLNKAYHMPQRVSASFFLHR